MISLLMEIGAWIQAVGAYMDQFQDSLAMFSAWWGLIVDWFAALWNNIITLWGLLG